MPSTSLLSAEEEVLAADKRHWSSDWRLIQGVGGRQGQDGRGLGLFF